MIFKTLYQWSNCKTEGNCLLSMMPAGENSDNFPLSNSSPIVVSVPCLSSRWMEQTSKFCFRNKVIIITRRFKKKKRGKKKVKLLPWQWPYFCSWLLYQGFSAVRIHISSHSMKEKSLTILWNVMYRFNRIVLLPNVTVTNKCNRELLTQ